MTNRPLDEFGQPLNPYFNWKLRAERDISELLGLSKGMLADGVVNDEEARYLHAWAKNHQENLTKWPLSLIFSRLQQIFSDGRVDDDERTELKELLAALVGGATSIVLGYEAASELPLDKPAPIICWQDEVYVFTGKFAFGTRQHCHMEVLNRGGGTEDDVTRRTTFLVLGTFGSRDWRQTSYGRKIEHAVHLRTQGFPIRIVGEDHWAKALSAAGAGV